MKDHRISSWLFLRLLGLVYLCAFASLATQIVGLVGVQGITPAGVSDGVLRTVSIGGAVLSVALVAGVLPLLLLPLLWLGYWWLSNIGGVFLSYQWDALLLETGLLALVLAPVAWRDRLRDAEPPPKLAVWLMLWLVFRLMFGSGAVKLASGDPTWHDLSALTFHYETQPIPTPAAYFAHHLPVVFNKASTAVTLAIELIAPLLIVGPRRLRLIAAVLLVGLQLVIAVTGNFAFFNLLSIALCLFLVDDDALLQVMSAFRRTGEVSAIRRTTESPAKAGHYLRSTVALRSTVVAVITIPVSLLTFTSSLGFLMPGWPIVAPIADAIAPLRSVNSYGLFAVMTTTRPEIIVEGSEDGETWRAYEFTYKPGDLARRPPWVAPHQPRLDWQMWFAALGRYEDNVWFQNFCARLLQGSPDVLRLLERDPFNGHPPRYVRAELYEYRFARDGRNWWTRQRLGAYAPVMSLR